MILIDTSGLLAAVDPRQVHHAAAARILIQPQTRILSPFVLAEVDYLLSTSTGQSEEFKLLRDVARGVYQIESMGRTDIAAASAVIEQYVDLRLGLADASIVVLAERYGCHDILTLDERHFRAVLGPRGRPFRILPSDADWEGGRDEDH